MKTACVIHRPHGFSLVEVMVALIVMSVGLLGIAKMQAVALSNTAVASTRSLAALEAASLAASMHVNRGYWSSGTVAASITVQGANNVTPLPGPSVDCMAVSCTPASLATYDLVKWAADLQPVIPNYKATITCTVAGTPSCTILLQWSERSVALNSQSQAGAEQTGGVNKPDYELYVEP